MTRWFLFLVLLHCCTAASAQLERAYDLGPLTFLDFKGFSLDLENTAGQLFFEYKTTLYNHHIDGVKIEYQLYEVGLNTQQSWIDIDQFSKESLDYFQLLFDMEYLYSLELNNAMLDNPFGDSRAIVDKLYDNKEIRTYKMKEETINGAKSDKVTRWQIHINEKIAAVKNKKNPELKLQKRIGMDVHLGVSYNIKTNELGAAFGNSIGLSYGLNFDFGRFVLIMAGSIASNKMPHTIDHYPGWHQGIIRNDILLNFGIGHRYDYKSISFIPYLGAAMTNILVNTKEYSNTYPSISDTDWRLGTGLMLQIPFKKKLRYYSQSPYAYNSNKIYTEHGLRFVFQYLGHPNIYGYKGASLSGSINYYYFFGSLKLADK